MIQPDFSSAQHASLVQNQSGPAGLLQALLVLPRLFWPQPDAPGDENGSDGVITSTVSDGLERPALPPAPAASETRIPVSVQESGSAVRPLTRFSASRDPLAWWSSARS